MIGEFKNFRVFVQSRNTTLVLCILLFVCSVTSAYLGTLSRFPDQDHYWALAKSLTIGKYTPWYSLPVDLPDTLRTFGYPSFLSVFQGMNLQMKYVFFVQYLLYSLAVYLIGLCAFGMGRGTLNLFLLFAAVNIQIPYYVGQISSEIPAVLMISMWVYIEFSRWDHRSRILLSSLVLGILFHFKPIYLFFAPLYYIYQLYRTRSFSRFVIGVGIFLVTISPYLIFNLKVHKVFKLTPLEGGAGVAHLGFWQHKLPGYYDETYWSHNMGEEPIRFMDMKDYESNVASYKNQWEAIIKEIADDYTDSDHIGDSLMIVSGQGLFKVYSSQYTQARETAIKDVLLLSIKESPVYYIKTRFYTAIRIWVTGVDLKTWRKPGVKNKIRAIIPFLITSITFVPGFAALFIFLFNSAFRRHFA